MCIAAGSGIVSSSGVARLPQSENVAPDGASLYKPDRCYTYSPPLEDPTESGVNEADREP
jgi:hypothetical protein